MLSRKIAIIVSLLAVCLLGLGTAFGVAAGEKFKGKGVITFRAGDTLTIKTSEGDMTVVVTPDTKIQHPVGLGARHKQVGQEVLIPGLRLKFEGVGGDQGQIMAAKIDFDTDDLALAEVIQAGLNPTARQQEVQGQQIARGREAIIVAQRDIEANKQMIAANKANIDEVAQSTQQRFKELGEYMVKNEATLYFATGDYTLTPEGKQKLRALAQEALAGKAYLLQVKGFADSVGTLADNQVLSKNRAEAVVAFLIQECGIPVGRIVAPGAMSETNPVASNETPSGRSENRRVEVKLLINKGIAGIG